MGLVTRQGKGSKLTVQEMDGNLEYLRASYKETINTSIDWSEASIQKFNLDEDVFFDFTGAVAGQKLTLLLNQSSGNIGWTSSVKWVNDVTPVIKNKVKLDTSFNTGTGFNGYIFTITLQSDGKILVGGFFTVYDGQSIGYGIARLNTDGSLDTTFVTGTGFDGSVFTITLQSDGKILVGGQFNEYNGVSVGRLVRLNTDGSLDTTFVTGTGFNNWVYSVVLQSGGKILVGGGFTDYDGQSIVRIARLNSDGSLDTTFITGTGFNNDVLSIVLQSDGKILLGGYFSEYDGQSIGYGIVRLNSDGTLDTTFLTGTGFIGNVNSVTLQSDGKILVVGGFTEYDGQSVVNVIRLSSDGSLDTTFDVESGFNNSIFTMILQSDGKILVGGSFTEYNGQLIGTGIARLNSDGSLDTTFDTGSGFNNSDSDTGVFITSIILQSDGKILAVGAFDYYDDVSIGDNIARLSQLPNYKVINFYFDGVNYIGESLNQVII